jgi:RarD protein
VLAIILKYALHFASAGTIVFVRMTVASLVLIAYYLVRNPKTLNKVFFPPHLPLVLAALLLSTNYYGYMKGLELTSASNAQIMIQVGPLVLVFIGVHYFKETMRLAQWIGVAIAALGFVLFNWDQMTVSLENVNAYLHGNGWIMVAAIAWAFYAALQKAQYKKWTPQETNLLIFTVCALALSPLATFSEITLTGPNTFSLWQWSVLIILGLNTVVAYGSFAAAMQKIPASYVSLIITLNPLLTLLLVGIIGSFGLTFIKPEPILWHGYLGAALVVIGVATAVSLRKRIPLSER